MITGALATRSELSFQRASSAARAADMETQREREADAPAQRRRASGAYAVRAAFMA